MKKTAENHHKGIQKKRRKRLVAAPYRKRKVARSETQGLSQLGSGMWEIVAATLKKQELVVERDLKLEGMY